MRRFRLRQDDLAWSDVADEVVLLDLRTSTYFSAKGSGAVLMDLLVAGASADELVTGLLNNYDVDETAARADVQEFLADLQSRELVDVTDG